MGIASTIVLILVVLVVGVAMGGYVISLYNSLIQVKNNIEKAWNNIDVLLQQRHDELPKLIDAVRGYMEHEKSVLEKITKLRVGYDEAASIEEKTKIENQLNREVARMRHVWESYPDLKSSQNFIQLMGRISALESSIADRREFFNDSVNIYNIQIERFPEMFLARMMSYQKHPFLEVPVETRQDVKIKI